MEQILTFEGTLKAEGMHTWKLQDYLGRSRIHEGSVLTLRLIGPIHDFASCRSSDTIERTPDAELQQQKSQGFEWILHNDANARRRARAHVTRGFRRQKAAQAQVLSSGSRSESLRTPKRDSSDNLQGVACQPVIKNQAARAREAKDFDTYGSVTARSLHQELVLRKTTNPDPFASFPVKLSQDKQELLDHCKPDSQTLSLHSDMVLTL